ncbi:hypothetical protein [Streptomyces sp. NPDC048202]|uniref:hypothetical protein n=1 Tax=Streptomyces sp. NPDC048202 TaxID=3365514 RepID=UPI003710629A
MTTTTITATMPKAPPHPLRAEAVRGFPPLAGIAVMVAVGVMMIATARTWQGDWAETAGRMHDGLLMALPIAAAAGCWHGGRERRRRTEELWGTAVRPPLTRLLASAVPVALWMAVGYLLVLASANVATWPYAQGDHPHLILVPGDTAALMAAVLLGHVVGRIVPSLLAAPLLGVAGYAGLALLGRNGVQPLDPASFTLNGSWPVWWQPLAMAAWTLGLALALTLAYAARRRATALLPLAAALTGATLLVQGGDATWQPDPLLRRQVCDTSTTPAICVNARYGDVLPQVTTALSGITGRLRGVEGLPVRWADRENGPRADEAQLPILTPVGWSLVRGRLVRPDRYAFEAAYALSDRGQCERQSERVMFATDAVMSYLLAPNPFRGEFDAIEAKGKAAARAHLRASLAARAKLAGMDEERRRVWLSAYFAARAVCDDEGVPSL